MRIVGWCRENGLAYQSLVNEISAEQIRTARNKSKLKPGPRDAPHLLKAKSVLDPFHHRLGTKSIQKSPPAGGGLSSTPSTFI
jgi:hypothetical protein